MSRIDAKKKLRASILDRLIDNEPHNKAELDLTHHHQIKQLRESVKRDLETLLNTRHYILHPPEEHKNLEKSLLNYGLPDLATVNIIDDNKRSEFIKSLEQTLRDYEPRFKNINISFIDNKDSTDRTLRFRIDAVIYADPQPETIIFDSILDSATRNVTVKEIS